jgi:hypothetical protein
LVRKRFIFRDCPWDEVPEPDRHIRRTGRCYYLLTMYLRRHPPDEESFRIKTLMQEFETEYQNTYQTIRQYSNDSKRFLKYVPIPTIIEQEEKTWEYAIKQLHEYGYYFVLPKSHHSGEWVEPSFRQFETYDLDNFREALNRAINRLQDGEDFGLTFDGLNIRKELAYTRQRREMLEDKLEEAKE